MIRRPPLRWFALLQQGKQMALVDAEHGLLRHAPIEAFQSGRNWRLTASSPRDQAYGLEQTPDFPLEAWLQHFLGQVYPLNRLCLLLVWPEPPSALTLQLWRMCLSHLDLADYAICSPLDCLALKLENSLLIYLDGGVAGLAACHQAKVTEASYLGYGRFLTRAVRRYLLQRYELRVDFATASTIWWRLEQDQTQLTVSGLNARQQPQHQLLLFEELQPLARAALTPLIEEVHTLSGVYPELPCQLLGNRSALPGMETLLAEQLPAGAEKIQAGDRMLIEGIQLRLMEVMT
ncbi:MAG: hypothetical protein IGS03_18090 [Candidatus Sericytochromatia bacterium]|nr:hypothetical protein [Candidatus Sericytochromatia bacterium]